MARNTPPQKPVYPKNDQPPRRAPQRPVYHTGGQQRQPRRPGGRIVYDQDRAAGASSGGRGAAPGQGAAPFVNTVPGGVPAPGTARPAQPAGGRAPGPDAPHAAGAARRAPEGQRAEAAGAQAAPRQSRPQGEAPRREQAQPRAEMPRRAPAAAPGHAHAGEHGGGAGRQQGHARAGEHGGAGRQQGPARQAAPGQDAPRSARPGVYDQDAAQRSGGPQAPVRGGRRRRKRKAPARPLTPGEARRRRMRRGILGGVLLAVLLTAGLFVSAAVLFKIKTVTVETTGGEAVYSDGEILAAFGHPAGENMFGFRAAQAAAAVEQALPYLESVAVSRRLPDTVVLRVTPAVETYAVNSAAGWAVLSGSYKVLRLAAEMPAGLMRIDGVEAVSPAPGQPVAFTEADKLATLQSILEKAGAQGLGPVTQVDLADTLQISLLYQDRIRIVLGTAHDLDYKIKWAWEMVTAGQTSDSLAEDARGTLDVSTRGEDGLGRALWRAGVL